MSEAPTAVTRRTESSPALPTLTPEPQPSAPAVVPTDQIPTVISEIDEEETVTEAEPVDDEEELAAASAAVMEETAAEAVQPYILPILSLIEEDLQVNLADGLGSYQGVVTQQGNNTSIATVSFQANMLYGSVNVLLRRYDQGWQAGWQATHYKDLLLTFTPPVLVVTGEEEIEETIVGVSVGTGDFEPLENLSDPHLPLDYIYGY
ncbi:MAG: hypothetical protein GTO55_06800 [Armatimonadetes bacterium]|nr:hypothetical protein [Armatimonadota bacterium]NIM23987.1 hypothetical protein [Armatimonadota bacterium]NIM67837.1 hypothetical protein [Armatimonadota bacterium]NIM76368.1 hypothetical protein [Armatimonadota bacterium]NIN06067.1 hypothetical protein [Armatimonadota bacterium]